METTESQRIFTYPKKAKGCTIECNICHTRFYGGMGGNRAGIAYAYQAAKEQFYEHNCGKQIINKLK